MVFESLGQLIHKKLDITHPFLPFSSFLSFFSPPPDYHCFILWLLQIDGFCILFHFLQFCLTIPMIAKSRFLPLFKILLFSNIRCFFEQFFHRTTLKCFFRWCFYVFGTLKFRSNYIYLFIYLFIN